MSFEMKIIRIHGREILDSRGNPTVEVEVTAQKETTGQKIMGRASVPSGASCGQFEAVELRDGDERFFGLGVSKVVQQINERIQKELLGLNVLNQRAIDEKLIVLDGTDNKCNLGANGILGVSMACCVCGANALGMPLYRYLGGVGIKKLPIPMFNVLNGGAHANNPLDLQEYMVVPICHKDFKEALQIGAEVYHFLKQNLTKDGLSTGVGDEGGFAPMLTSSDQALSYLQKAVKQAGYVPGKDVAFAIDAASSELYKEKEQRYVFREEGKVKTAEEMISYFEELSKMFPILSLEDGLAENDWENWKLLTARLGEQMLLVGDDLFVTNPKRIQCGIDLGVANAVLIKLNQIGTVTEAIEAVEMAKKAGYKVIVSHRSGETENTFLADFAVAMSADYIKSGAPCRSERTAKYNQLLRIEEIIGDLDALPSYQGS